MDAEAKGTARLTGSGSPSSKASRPITANFRTGPSGGRHGTDQNGGCPLELTGRLLGVEEIRGYLFKKTRDGKWQKRWFETNGCFLTYYKVSTRWLWRLRY